ncbi:hypothetical protein [Tropicibacter alexandrii]|uniref:hypothetical protein n=1 Tax=Tropicibacter alexandrii TaxID=2267683 RepID=UPI0013E8EBCC|nr:hypothetical protein [Tropicibacter alexandrii]
MIFNLVFQTSGLRLMHSADLDDMRRAIADEDDDGPDGGSPHAAPHPEHDRAVA